MILLVGIRKKQLVTLTHVHLGKTVIKPAYVCQCVLLLCNKALSYSICSIHIKPPTLNEAKLQASRQV